MVILRLSEKALIMKLLNTIILFLIISASQLSAQSISGIIRDGSGDPVPFATVYISEIKHGTTANIKGEYHLNLKEGTYTIFFQSLGFSPTIKKITIANEKRNMDIKLQVQFYVIPEVRVTSSGEDPAYSIMRKAIGLAPYYLNYIEHYKAEVYIKGSFVIRKIPKLLLRNMEVNEEKIKTNEAYIIESINEIEFNAPNNYDQKIISQQSTLPDAGSTDISPMDVVKASFYEPVLADVAISPLAPNAFAHYKFKYEGSTPQGSYVINKISVIPRRKSQQVFEGTIYIIEGLWCLHSLELKNNNLAGSLSISQIYTPVQDDLWMPVSHNFEVDISIVGVKGDGEYGSAITYSDVIPNTDLKKPDAIELIDYTVSIDEESIAELSKERQKIEDILEKDEMNNRDMTKLSRLMAKEAKRSNPEESELELKNTTTFTVEEDADRRDSSYWNNVRPIPLSDEEIKSIRTSDSIKAIRRARLAKMKNEEVDTSIVIPPRSFKKTVNDFLFGKSFASEDRSWSFRFGGVFNTDRIGFNSVEGLYYGTDLRLRKSWKDGPSLTIRPSAEWAFAREDLRWRITGSFYYNRMKMARFLFWVGDETRDYNRLTGIGNTMNMATSLLFKDNYLKLYRSKYTTISHRQELFNGFNAELRYNYEQRTSLENNTNFSFRYRNEDYSVNLPDNPYLPDPVLNDIGYGIRDHYHHSGALSLTYVPRQKYTMTNNAKYSVGSDYPTFRLDYKHGINIYKDNTRASYDLIKFEVGESESMGAFAEYSWKIRAGAFLNNDGAQYQDFFHFNSQPLPLLFTNYREVFMLPAYYSLATPDYFIELHGRFTTPYLLLKLLPVLSNTLMRENLSLAYLYTPESGSYTEIGYTLSEILFVGRFGVFVGFEDLSYSSVGFRFTFIFN